MKAQHTIESTNSLLSYGSAIFEQKEFKNFDQSCAHPFSTTTPCLVSDKDSFSDTSSLPRLSFDGHDNSFHLRKRKASDPLEQTRFKSNVRRSMSRSKSVFSLSSNVLRESSKLICNNKKGTESKELCPVFTPSLQVANQLFQEAEMEPGSLRLNQTPSLGNVSAGTPSSSCSSLGGNGTTAVATVSTVSSAGSSLSCGTTEVLPSPDLTGKSTKNCYGWFVEMDNDNEESHAVDPYVQSKTDLAFKASTAPKRSGYEQDVAYAHAADTVDDVLGDFF